MVTLKASLAQYCKYNILAEGHILLCPHCKITFV